MSAKKRYPAAIMGTCVVPWTADLKFDEKLFRAQVRSIAQGLTKHLYVFGTAGEGYAVTDSQFESIARAFYEEGTANGVETTLGIISLSLPTILERIEKGRGWGFRRFQISLPSWGALKDREVEAFFQETCGRFTDNSFMHYNLMRTKRLITGTEYGRLAEKHPNFVATKNGRDEEAFLVELLEKSPQLQHFLGESGYARMRDRFECGLLISLAATNHSQAKAFLAARGDRLKKMGGELKPALEALLTAAGKNEFMDGAYDKLLYKLHEPGFPLRLLPPYESFTEGDFKTYQEKLKKAAPSWMP